jgi:hypothetical protein
MTPDIGDEQFPGGRQMSNPLHQGRRRFCGGVLTTVAAAQLGMIASSKAHGSNGKRGAPAPIRPGTGASFGALKQVDAGLLNLGYAEVGPASGPGGTRS